MLFQADITVKLNFKAGLFPSTFYGFMGFDTMSEDRATQPMEAGG